jgi:hypothetical protein
LQIPTAVIHRELPAIDEEHFGSVKKLAMNNIKRFSHFRVSAFPHFGPSSVLICFVRISSFAVLVSLFIRFSLPALLLLFLLVQTN